MWQAKIVSGIQKDCALWFFLREYLRLHCNAFFMPLSIHIILTLSSHYYWTLLCLLFSIHLHANSWLLFPGHLIICPLFARRLKKRIGWLLCFIHGRAPCSWMERKGSEKLWPGIVWAGNVCASWERPALPMQFDLNCQPGCCAFVVCFWTRDGQQCLVLQSGQMAVEMILLTLIFLKGIQACTRGVNC